MNFSLNVIQSWYSVDFEELYSSECQAQGYRKASKSKDM